MFFNQPDIIKTETDVVLGAVRVDGENLNFLNLINKTITFYAFHIRKDVEDLMSDTISYRRALMLTAEKIYSRLEMYEELPPRDEEHLAELMMQSKNFEMWESDVKRRFFSIHTDKVTEETPVPVTGEGGISQADIIEIKGRTNLDLILEKLAMYMDVGGASSY